MTPLSVTGIRNYWLATNRQISSSIKLENYIQSHPATKASLWDFGQAKDFAYIWIRGWAGGMFDHELRSLRPDLLELKSDYQTVYLNYNYNDSVDIFSACWDHLYIREKRAKVLIDMYPDRHLFYEPITNEVGIIKSNHCVTKP